MSGPAPLTVEVREKRVDVVVLDVAGDLVVTNRDELRSAVEAVLEDGFDVIIACHGITHIDTPSLAVLVQLRQRGEVDGRRCVVAGLPDTFGELVEDLRMEEGLVFAGTVEEALRLRGA